MSDLTADQLAEKLTGAINGNVMAYRTCPGDPIGDFPTVRHVPGEGCEHCESLGNLDALLALAKRTEQAEKERDTMRIQRDRYRSAHATQEKLRELAEADRDRLAAALREAEQADHPLDVIREALNPGDGDG